MWIAPLVSLCRAGLPFERQDLCLLSQGFSSGNSRKVSRGSVILLVARCPPQLQEIAVPVPARLVARQDHFGPDESDSVLGLRRNQIRLSVNAPTGRFQFARPTSDGQRLLVAGRKKASWAGFVMVTLPWQAGSVPGLVEDFLAGTRLDLTPLCNPSN